MNLNTLITESYGHEPIPIDFVYLGRPVQGTNFAVEREQRQV